MLLSINGFILNTNDVIIYEFVTLDQQVYQNYAKSGSSGIEAVFNLKKKKWDLSVNYSYARANNNSTVDNYKVPQTANQFAGIAAHKGVAIFNYAVTKNISFNTTLIYSGKRFAYTTSDSTGTPVATQLDPYLLVNGFINYHSDGFTVGFGGYDLLNQKPAIPQAYNGNYAPIPGRSSEFVVKVSYQLNFKK